MIRLTVAIGFVCGGCNRSEAGVVQKCPWRCKASTDPFTHKKKKKYSSWGFFGSVMWGAPAGVGGGWVGGGVNKFNTSGAWRGRVVYFIRWVDAGLLHAARQVGLTGAIQRGAGPVWVSVAACEEGEEEDEAAAAGSSQTSPEAQRGIVDSGASLPTPGMLCEGLDWGGDTRRLCRCLGGEAEK